MFTTTEKYNTQVYLLTKIGPNQYNHYGYCDPRRANMTLIVIGLWLIRSLAKDYDA
jgi:hypothetical protein